MTAETSRQIRDIIAEYAECDTKILTPTTRLGVDLGLDEFDFCGILTSIEEKFNIEISDATWLGIHTLGELETYVIETQRIGVA